MSQNIYSIDDWVASTSYVKNAIVKNGNYYYYALTNHTSSSSFETDLAAGNLWGGRITDNGENKPHFIWKCAPGLSVDNEPKIKKIQFGDGYSQKLNDGINNILPSINLTFENIDTEEVTAILHFLESRAGSESFVFLAPAPRGTLGRWTCERWTDTLDFYNNYTIQAKFDRSVV